MHINTLMYKKFFALTRSIYTNIYFSEAKVSWMLFSKSDTERKKVRFH